MLWEFGRVRRLLIGKPRDRRHADIVAVGMLPERCPFGAALPRLGLLLRRQLGVTVT